MNQQTLWAILNVVLLGCLLIAWAGVLWVALHVSSIVLNTLQALVDLAQLS